MSGGSFGEVEASFDFNEVLSHNIRPERLIARQLSDVIPLFDIN